MIIEDYANSSTVEVGGDRRLHTRSVSLDEASHVSLQGDYFLVCNGAYHQSFGGWHLYLKNTSTSKNCFIQVIQFAANQPGYFMLGHGGSTVGNATAITPVNLNLGSAKVAPVEAYHGSSGSLTFGTAPTFFIGGIVNAYQKHSEVFGGSLILGVNNSISVMWDWSITAGVVAIGIQFYFKDI